MLTALYLLEPQALGPEQQPASTYLAIRVTTSSVHNIFDFYGLQYSS